MGHGAAGWAGAGRGGPHDERYFSRALASRTELEALFEIETPPGRLAALFAQITSGANPPLKVYVRYPS